MKNNSLISKIIDDGTYALSEQKNAIYCFENQQGRSIASEVTDVICNLSQISKLVPLRLGDKERRHNLLKACEYLRGSLAVLR